MDARRGTRGMVVPFPSFATPQTRGYGATRSRASPAMTEQVLPVEVELDGRGLPLGRPSAHPCRTFAQARLVDKDDYAAFPLGFF